jgi:hypothetical protein
MNPLPRHRYTLLRRFEVAGRQGVATDGTHIWVSGSTTLHRYAADGTLFAENHARTLNCCPRLVSTWRWV